MNAEREKTFGSPEAYDLADKFDAQREDIKATLAEIASHNMVSTGAIEAAQRALEDLRSAMEGMKRTV